MISRDDLLHWFTYEPDNGVFRWRQSPANSVKVGDIAGSIYDVSKRQRRRLFLRGEKIASSRAAYMYEHGDIPANALIDHKDGDTLNDRIDNLRLASAVQNNWNRLRGESLMQGVSKDERGRFKSRIQTPDGRKINLGTWATEAEAHAAYMGAAAILHGEFWIGNRQANAA